jgi:predicted transcriptional regulator
LSISALVQSHFPVADPLDKVTALVDVLAENSFVVVMDKKEFKGVLTASDIVQKSHLIAVDCLQDKPHVDEHFDSEKVLEIMQNTKLNVLPVFNGNHQFIGVILQESIASHLKSHLKKLLLARPPKRKS